MMPESELAALTRLIEELNESTGDLVDRSAEQTQVQVELRQELAAVRKKLLEFVPKRGFRWAIAGLILAGLLVAAVVGANQRTVKRFERESIATDQAFCALTNRTFAEINRNRDANRQAYNLLVQPHTPPDSPLVKFRDDLLRTIDGNLPQLDCSGIGDGKVNFSLQDAIRNGTVPTPTTQP